MLADDVIDNARVAPIGTETLRALQKRSDARGLFRLIGHLAAIGGAGLLYGLALAHSGAMVITALSAVALGFTLVTMFAAMHESVHRTAFRSRSLNDSVAWLAGLLSFYNSTFYRPYHAWHHRFTQLPGQDPELDDPKPTSQWSYFVEISGIPWWMGKARTHLALAMGKTSSYPFLNDKNRVGVVRSVRFQLLAYGLAIAVSLWMGRAYFFTYWLLPVALAQPLLRAILLAEHMGCSESADMLTNTRTTYTIWPVRYLMWEMPYHADHHRYPALPFFALAPVHVTLGPHLAHVAREGYARLNLGFLKDLRNRTTLHHEPSKRQL